MNSIDESIDGKCRALEQWEIMEKAPAAYATAPDASVSSRYAFVGTNRVIKYMQDDGYQVMKCLGGLRGRSRDFGTHTVRFRKDFTSFRQGDLFPEVVFTNAHDRSSRAVLELGFWRVACDNGLVVGTGAGMQVGLSHLGNVRERIITAADHIMSNVPKVAGVIDAWRSRQLNSGEIREFGERAAALRDWKLAPDGVTAWHRKEDMDDSLWTVFNRVQENILGGKVRLRNPKGGYRRLRPVRAVKAVMQLNRRLWDIASDFLPS